VHKVIEEILESNKWRDGDFAKFKVNSTNVDEDLWCRMCIPMIYAHWEGFVVSSIKLLLEHLNKLELNPQDVKTSLVVVGLGDSYKSLSGKQSFKQRVEFTDKFSRICQEQLKFSKKVDTKSNLRSDILKELCEMFSLDSSGFDEHTGDIDRLVNVRNSIAHGENSIVVRMDNVEKYINAVTNATDILTSELQKFLDGEEYLIIKSA
jgi:hypothetical protein